MIKAEYSVLGVMSGTSLDGVDLAHCLFSVSSSGRWNFEIGQVATIPYSEEWKTRLNDAISFSKADLRSLDNDYTEYLASVIRDFIANNDLTELDAVCSHGHTVLHQPWNGYTLQIGNQPILAGKIDQKVVCDFRVQDVKLGGQGAPLVPIGDRLLFSEYKYCINIGGFANLSYESTTGRIAYDICPANIVLNRFAEVLGSPFDPGGDLARSGKLDQDLLAKLNALPYYKKDPPKSLGLEWVLEQLIPLFDKSGLGVTTILRSFTEHVAMQISLQMEDDSNALLTGGGVYNDFLIERLRNHSGSEIFVPPDQLIEYKEALIFGLLGVLKLREEPNCLASVTGAETDHSSGVIFLPN